MIQYFIFSCNIRYLLCTILFILNIVSAVVISQLTHWGRVRHICVSKLAIIGSDNGLSPGRCQAIIWTNARILLIGPLKTTVSEILIEIHSFLFKKMHLKMSSEKHQYRMDPPGLLPATAWCSHLTSGCVLLNWRLTFWTPRVTPHSTHHFSLIGHMDSTQSIRYIALTNVRLYCLINKNAVEYCSALAQVTVTNHEETCQTVKPMMTSSHEKAFYITDPLRHSPKKGQ